MLSNPKFLSIERVKSTRSYKRIVKKEKYFFSIFIVVVLTAIFGIIHAVGK